VSTIPRVLLLGDSIRMSYQRLVAQLLEGKADVVGPSVNCQYSLYTLSSLPHWIAELGKPDIVHWNNGIHDVGHNPHRSPVQMPIEMYRANLEFILRSLLELTPHVIWATSTLVHPQRSFCDDQWSWRNEEIDEYNRVAAELMNQNGIPINDLHTLVSENIEAFLADDGLHLSEAGQAACARAVAQAVSVYLPED
jgi:lysophospholipase L1-like esterase